LQDRFWFEDNRYSNQLKETALRLTEAEGVKVKDGAERAAGGVKKLLATPKN
jgi:hypothetical protein